MTRVINNSIVQRRNEARTVMFGSAGTKRHAANTVSSGWTRKTIALLTLLFLLFYFCSVNLVLVRHLICGGVYDRNHLSCFARQRRRVHCAGRRATAVLRRTAAKSHHPATIKFDYAEGQATHDRYGCCVCMELGVSAGVTREYCDTSLLYTLVGTVLACDARLFCADSDACMDACCIPTDDAYNS